MKIINITNNNEKINKNNNSYSKIHKEARNIKIGNYLGKFNSYNGHSTNINSPKKISEDKNIKNNNQNKMRKIPLNRKKNILNKENIKFNNSTNSRLTKNIKNINENPVKTPNKKFLINKSNKLNINELKIKINKELLSIKNSSQKEKNNLTKKSVFQKKKLNQENKLKINNDKNIKENENKIIKDKISNKNKNIYKKIIPLSSGEGRNTNFLKIRKQNTKEDDALAKKNTGIIEIKVGSLSNSTRYSANNNHSLPIQKQEEKNNSYINSNENITKKYYSNHNFVNINLCKEKDRSDVIYIEDKFLKKENSFPKYKCNISIRNDENKIKNSFENRLNRKSYYSQNNTNKKNYIHNFNNNIIYRTYNSFEECKSNSVINGNRDDNEKNKKINTYNNQIKMYDIGKYEGIILNDKREINGIMIYNNGSRYEGEWKNDKRSGKGVFISSYYFNCENNIGFKYEGEFVNDKFEGYGKALYTNGDIYEGEWKNNKQYGRGTLTNIGGTKYVGDWINGIFEGNGIYYMNNGERYEGHFSNNKYNGYGKYFKLNGDIIEGIFKDDEPTLNSIIYRNH